MEVTDSKWYIDFEKRQIAENEYGDRTLPGLLENAQDLFAVGGWHGG
jgi:hypothetical protein